MRVLNSIHASVFAAGMFALLAMTVAPQQAAARGAPDSFADLVEKLQPAVVNISSTQVIDDSGVEEFQDLFREFLERRRGGEGAGDRLADSPGGAVVLER